MHPPTRGGTDGVLRRVLKTERRAARQPDGNVAAL